MDNWTETRLYYVQKNDYPDNSRGHYWVNTTTENELNMADPSSLMWFIEKLYLHFPAENYFVAMWDHNWGWHPG